MSSVGVLQAVEDLHGGVWSLFEDIPVRVCRVTSTPPRRLQYVEGPRTKEVAFKLLTLVPLQYGNASACQRYPRYTLKPNELS